MGQKGLDFKHKEVINISDGKRLGFVQVKPKMQELLLLKVLLDFLKYIKKNYLY